MKPLSPSQRFARAIPAYAPPVLITIGILVGWELAIDVLRIPSFLLPKPSAVAVEFVRLWKIVLPHVWITLFEAVVGLILAGAISIVLAVGIVHFKVIERTVYPYAVATKVVPIIAVAPLLTVWFGFGLEPKIVTAILVSYFPILVNTVKGLQSADRQMVRLMKSLFATRWQIFTKISIKYSLPYIFAGFRISSTLAVIGAIVGEFVGADRGLGFFLVIAQSELDVRKMFVGVLLCALLGLFLFLLVVALERYFLFWHESADATEEAI
jgi:NitT/TauT family transport system permease protein